ncbi:hypothetical protein B0H12DRAFT_1127018 [Mycena haematopus]|nr:hypothetical protein B0H12DRAFT_1127018 [Mycena haematopus]
MGIRTRLRRGVEEWKRISEPSGCSREGSDGLREDIQDSVNELSRNTIGESHL